MYRKFIATITAASIALTAMGAAPALADNQRTARTVAAIIGLAAVGAIIHENRKDRKKEAEYERYNPKPIYEQPTRKYEPPRVIQPAPRPLPNRAQRKLLPGNCLQSFETRRGTVRMFGARCLNRNYDFAHRLPSQCKTSLNTKRGDRRGYEARCLRDQGYRLARG